MRADARRAAREDCRSSPTTFNRMLERLEDERRDAGRAVLRAQEQERGAHRPGPPRRGQPGADRDPAAPLGDDRRRARTGCARSCRRPRSSSRQAMDELLALARQLRPTALDDHGLIAALASQVADFGQRTGDADALPPPRRAPDALRRGAARDLPRRRRRASPTSPSTPAPRDVDVELSFVGRTMLRVRDDGGGFDGRRAADGNGRVRGRPGGLGLSGMRERALLVGGQPRRSSPRPARAPPSS